MKTADLIERLAADTAVHAKPPAAVVGWAFGSGSLVSVALFVAFISWRPDIAAAAETVRFLLKFVIAVTLAVGAIGLVLRLSRPAVPPGPWPWLMLAAGLLLAVSLIVELAVVPGEQRLSRLIGVNWYYCLILIPLLSAAPLAGLLYTLRAGAPENPGLSGAVAGLAAGGIAATIYAAHCPDDSPLFVATWYTLAIGVVTLTGMFAGRRLLRW